MDCSWNSPGQNQKEWVAFPFSRGSSQPRNRTWVSCNTGRFFTSWATREYLINNIPIFKWKVQIKNFCCSNKCEERIYVYVLARSSLDMKSWRKEIQRGRGWLTSLNLRTHMKLWDVCIFNWSNHPCSDFALSDSHPNYYSTFPGGQPKGDNGWPYEFKHLEPYD